MLLRKSKLLFSIVTSKKMDLPQAKILFITILSILVLQILALDENEPELLYVVENGIYRMKLNATDKQLIASAIHATSLDYHHKKSLLFWSDIATHKIYSKDLFDNSSEIKTVIAGQDDWLPKAIAVDWIHDKIFVMDQGGRKIDVFELDGSAKVEGVFRNMSNYQLSSDNTWDIAVDPFEGLVFIGEGTQVWRVAMDFSNSKAITYKAAHSAIALDPACQCIYSGDPIGLWYDNDYKGYARDYVNGYEHPSDHLRGAAMRARTIAKYSNSFFWIDVRDNDDVRGFNRLDRFYYSEIDKTMGNVVCLRVRHPSKQDIHKAINANGCNNKPCEYMCLSSSRKYSTLDHSCFDKNGKRIDVIREPETNAASTTKT